LGKNHVRVTAAVFDTRICPPIAPKPAWPQVSAPGRVQDMKEKVPVKPGVVSGTPVRILKETPAAVPVPTTLRTAWAFAELAVSSTRRGAIAMAVRADVRRVGRF